MSREERLTRLCLSLSTWDSHPCSSLFLFPLQPPLSIIHIQGLGPLNNRLTGKIRGTSHSQAPGEEVKLSGLASESTLPVRCPSQTLCALGGPVPPGPILSIGWKRDGWVRAPLQSIFHPTVAELKGRLYSLGMVLLCMFFQRKQISV